MVARRAAGGGERVCAGGGRCICLSEAGSDGVCPRIAGQVSLSRGIALRKIWMIATGLLACSLWSGAARAGDYTEGFESATVPGMPAGWVATSEGGSRLWQTSATEPDAGSRCAAADPFGAVGLDMRLDSPPISIAAADGQVTFRQVRDLGSADCGVLEISIDGGPFEDIVAAGGSFLAGAYDSNAIGPLAGRQAWCGPAGEGYSTTTVQLPASASGRAIQLRWRLRPGGDSAEGSAWRIDSVSVSGVERCGSGVCGAGGLSGAVGGLAGVSGLRRRRLRRR